MALPWLRSPSYADLICMATFQLRGLSHVVALTAGIVPPGSMILAAALGRAPAAPLGRSLITPSPPLRGQEERAIAHLFFLLKYVIIEALLTSLIGPANTSIIRAFRDWLCWKQKFQRACLPEAASVAFSSHPLKARLTYRSLKEGSVWIKYCIMPKQGDFYYCFKISSGYFSPFPLPVYSLSGRTAVLVLCTRYVTWR